jgi:hypothetical protein
MKLYYLDINSSIRYPVEEDYLDFISQFGIDYIPFNEIYEIKFLNYELYIISENMFFIKGLSYFDFYNLQSKYNYSSKSVNYIDRVSGKVTKIDAKIYEKFVHKVVYIPINRVQLLVIYFEDEVYFVRLEGINNFWIVNQTSQHYLSHYEALKLMYSVVK